MEICLAHLTVMDLVCMLDDRRVMRKVQKTVVLKVMSLVPLSALLMEISMVQTMEKNWLSTEICLAHPTATTKATSLVCLLEYLMVIKMAQTKERHSVQLTEIDWVQLTD